MEKASILSDLKVIELAGVLAGPSVGLFLAELGAKVLKVENSRTGGDVTRQWKSPKEDVNDTASAYYWSVNAMKEVQMMDLTDAEQIQAFHEMVEDADVVITNYKSGDDVKLHVDARTLMTLNPRLIYASINGFGEGSPRTAYDLILQAESGFMSMNGETPGHPVKMPVALIDLLAGHQLKEAILVALLHRLKTGEGSHVSVSLFDSAVASLANQASNWLNAHHLPVASGSLHPNIAPYGEIFTTADKHLITFAIGSDRQFESLCQLIGLKDVPSDEQFRTNPKRVVNRTALFDLMSPAIQEQSFQSIYDGCLANGIPIGKIRNLEEVFALPEAQALLKRFNANGKDITTVASVAFRFHEHFHVEIAKTDHDIKLILDLRYRVLRQPWNQDYESSTDGMEKTSINAMIRKKDAAVACGRLQDNGGGVGQVRFMAVAPELQGKGLGTMIMAELEDQARKMGLQTIELHARDNALQFYDSLGYENVGPSYKLWDIIPHFLMRKHL